MTQSDFNILVKKNGSKNLGWRTDRLNYDPNDIENAFSQHWQNENKGRLGTNFGQGILQDLFFRRTEVFKGHETYQLFHKVSNKERLIVATVIQWLGTNVGFCFLREVLDKTGYKIVKK
jgi:hypothetical protein